MTWPNRIRLFFGLIVVLAIVAGATLVFTQRQSRAESVTATITAEDYAAGAAFPGTVITGDVEPGDTVTAGEVLFEIRSPLLARDLATDSVTAADLGVDVADDGTFTVVSTVDGTVSEVLAPVGDFVQTGQVLARIDRDETMGVSAQFTLTARDYGRIAPGSAVDLRLPDDRTIAGTVAQIDVDTVAGEAASVITIDSPVLTTRPIGGLYRPGTPVVATLHLRDDGPWAGVTDALGDFLRKVGL